MCMMAPICGGIAPGGIGVKATAAWDTACTGGGGRAAAENGTLAGVAGTVAGPGIVFQLGGGGAALTDGGGPRSGAEVGGAIESTRASLHTIVWTKSQAEIHEIQEANSNKLNAASA